MTSRLRRAAIVAASVLSICATAAFAVKPGAVKGAKYAGVVRDENVALSVASNGKTARPSLPFAPAFCQGGGGGEVQHTQFSPISSSGTYTTKITYTVTGSTRVFATITIKGVFLGKSFDGQLKASFTPATECSGQESFLAKTK
jgi:hypothetical protein